MKDAAKDPFKWLEPFSHSFAKWTGTSWAFFIAFGLTLAWIVSGPFFHYSDSWQIAMNTVSSVVTFLMVFIMQRSQNKDTLAMQLKLNEIIVALEGANNHVIGIEESSEDDIKALLERHQALAERLKRRGPQRLAS
jgi:low affinity Fe/Cu permease